MNSNLLKTSLLGTQILHHIVVLGAVTAPIWSWAVLPIVLAVLVSSVAVWRIISSTICPLTLLENVIRRKLGLQEIHTFIGHYYVRPIHVFLDNLIGVL